ncbi:Tat pathway signal sequence domain protein [Nocardiopsis sp. MG754419]|nr:BNR repeat-containing protein [Nocardiopsis sp. MG754419]MBR8740819.1 Tat pathway signal sequence domain protein [Nocardiopsis sp. MG754419]
MATALSLTLPLLHAPAHAAGLTPIGDHVLDEEAIFFVSYDGLVNNSSYQQDAILTHGGHQYATWYTDDRSPVIARRTHSGRGDHGPWETVTLPHSLSEDNSHNTISLGVSEEDGRLHVALDTHSSTLYYFRSVAGLVDDPSVPWDAASFGSVRRDLEGVDAGVFTYPRFLQSPSGALQLSFRTGVSGNGASELAEYRDGEWTRLGAWSSATGTYTADGGGGTSERRNLYLHGIDYDVDGRLHAAFTWREQDGAVACDAGGITNHDTGYVYSDDEGRTWHTDDGAAAATTGSDHLVSVTTPGHVVDPLPADHALINQESQATDSAGDPHVIISYVPGRFTSCVTDFAVDRREHGRVFHLYRDASGEWNKVEIPEPLDAFGRSELVMDADDNAYVVLPGGRIMAATADSDWSDWTKVHDGLDAFGEVLVDDDRLIEDGVFSVLYQEPSTGTTPSPIRVADFSVE